MPPKVSSANKSSNKESDRLKCLQHHPKYYLVGGDFFVIIDDTVFRIHSYFFRREATKFFNKQTDPTSPGDEKRGCTEDTAVLVKNATIQEFEHFLWVFYNPLYDIYEAPIDVWFSILRLAHEWGFPEVTRFALREVKRRECEVSLVERIVLYQKYNAPAEYLVPLYAELCARPTSPTEEETVLLGFEQTVKIFKARERIRSSGGVSPLPPGIKEPDTYPTISSILGLPEYTGNTLDIDSTEDGDAPTTINGAPIVRAPVHRKNTSGRTSLKVN